MLVAFVVATSGAAGLVVATRAALDTPVRDDVSASALDRPDVRFTNYLLVGSDSREGADPTDPDFGNVGSADDVGGERSDTLIVLHVEEGTGEASLLSIPRDLWVELGSGSAKQRINVAYGEGRDVLVRTVQRALGIPVHHYLEVDFQGFKRIVDAVGGVTICVPHPSRDRKVGLRIPAGCSTLDGTRALAYARSRYFEERIDGEWKRDGTSDIGRGARQRAFLAALATGTAAAIADQPFRLGSTMRDGLGALVVDRDLAMDAFLADLARAGRTSIRSYQLAVFGDSVGGASVLRLSTDSKPVLDFFGGVGPRPPEGD